jgi:hypothetical protein
MLHRGDRRGDRLNSLSLAAFTEVWYTLDERIDDFWFLVCD